MENKLQQIITWLCRHPLRRTKTIVNDKPKVSRNQPCPCGSGRKYKHCCWLKRRIPITKLAEKELDKERKSLLKKAGKEYKELTNGM